MLLNGVGTPNCWLVRDSIHFRGDYTITLLPDHSQPAVQIRVKTDYVNDRRVFFLHTNSDDHPQVEWNSIISSFIKKNKILKI